MMVVFGSGALARTPTSDIHKNGKRIYDGNKFYAFHIFFMLFATKTVKALDLNFIFISIKKKEKQEKNTRASSEAKRDEMLRFFDLRLQCII